MVYTPQTALEILGMIHQKGWNVYPVQGQMIRSRLESIITRGPISRIEELGKYLLLPKSDDPKNPSIVKEAFYQVNNRFPTIRIDRDPIKIFNLYTRRDKVHIRDSHGRVESISYNGFRTRLTTLQRYGLRREF
jgi:hypothetical protein